MNLKIIPTITALALFADVCQAGLLLYEPFRTGGPDYALGDLTGQSPAVLGETGAWAVSGSGPTATVASPSLTRSGYFPAGGSVVLSYTNPPSASSIFSRSLSNSVFIGSLSSNGAAINQGVFYFSFFYSLNNTAGNGQTCVRLGDATGANYIELGSGYRELDLNQVQGGTTTRTNIGAYFTVGATYQFLIKVDFNARLITLWANPGFYLTTDPGAPLLTLTLNGNPMFSRISLYNNVTGSGTRTVTIDELMLGTAVVDVTTPNPAGGPVPMPPVAVATPTLPTQIRDGLTYYFGAERQTWRDHEDVITGMDWSLPPSVAPASNAYMKIYAWSDVTNFPVRLLGIVTADWKDLEPTPGEFDLSSLTNQIEASLAAGYEGIILSLYNNVYDFNWLDTHGDPIPAGQLTTSQQNTRLSNITAPGWLVTNYNVPTRLESAVMNTSTPFQIRNMAVENATFRFYYDRFIRTVGAAILPRYGDKLRVVYINLPSSTRGEEGESIPNDTADLQLLKERFQLWSDVFGRYRSRICYCGDSSNSLSLAFSYGFGQRNGFVEYYLIDSDSLVMGQALGTNGYSTVVEVPAIREGRAFGDENEEYNDNTARFGSADKWLHRYQEAELRMQQMRRNWDYEAADALFLDPFILAYTGLELDRQIEGAPDVWCYLRESYVQDPPNAGNSKSVKNWERWLIQRDTPGHPTTPMHPVQRETPASVLDVYAKPYTDYIARSGDRFGFTLTADFHAPYGTAVKVSYFDETPWQLSYPATNGTWKVRSVPCTGDGQLKTATFYLPDSAFNGTDTNEDLVITATTATNATIRFVRIIALPPAPERRLDFRQFTISSVPGLDLSGGLAIANTYASGTRALDCTVNLAGNTWKRLNFAYFVTTNTLMTLDFQSSNVGQIIALGLDENTNTTDGPRLFQLAGSQTAPTNGFIPNYTNYTAGSGWKTYTIPIGKYYTGSMTSLVLVAQDNAASAANAQFRNLRVYESDSLYAPTVGFVTPTNKQELYANVLMVQGTAFAGRSQDTIAAVFLYLDRTLVSTLTNTPYMWDTSIPALANVAPGWHSLELRATDNRGAEASAVTAITVLQPLAASDDSATTVLNTPVIVDVLANDSGAGSLHITGVSAPLAGTAVTNLSGQIVYTPNAGFLGDDTFTYTVSDGTSSATATVTIHVAFYNGMIWYPFNQTSGLTTPDAGGAFTGVLNGFTNDPAQWVAGKWNRTINFDGVANYLAISNYSGIFGASNRTCAAWINTTGTGQMPVIAWGPDVTGNKWTFLIQNGHVRIEVTSGYIEGTTLVNDGQWHHVAVTFDNAITSDIKAAGKLYVDGVQETSFTTTASHTVNTTSSGDVKIGSDVQGRYFLGQIDEPRIYNRALSGSEISALVTVTNQSAAAWYYRYFGDAVPDWTNDADGDGLSQLAEYAVGSEPHLAGASGLHLNAAVVENYVRVQFLRRLPETTELQYTLQVSSDLVNWNLLNATQVDAQPADQPGFENVTYEVNDPLPLHSAQFFRLNVDLP